MKKYGFFYQFLILGGAWGLASQALAEETLFELVPNANGATGIEFKIGYTLGTHKGVALKASGLVEVSTENSQLALKSTSIKVPISSIRTGAELRDCHLQEAMGINYSISDYPSQHVCTGNQLPASGNNAVVYPTIDFSLVSAQISGSPTHLEPGKTFQVSALGNWTIHGISKQQPIALTLNPQEDGRVFVTGNTSFNLKDFNVVVIPWAGLIKVKDTALVELNLVFTPKP